MKNNESVFGSAHLSSLLLSVCVYQTNTIVTFCKTVTIYAPALLSLVSLVLKTRYPLRTKDQAQMVRRWRRRVGK
jgi:hypothetical protein